MAKQIADRHWRSRLSKEDEALVLGWVQEIGLHRIARIMAALIAASANSKKRLEIDTLLQLAVLVRDCPDRGTHSLAAEAVQNNPREMVNPDDRVDSLLDHYYENWQALKWLVEKTPREYPRSEGSSSLQRNEQKIIQSIMEIIPKSIDLYTILLSEAEKLGPEKVKVVKKRGRSHVMKVLAKRLHERGTSQLTEGAHPLPHSLFDLIVGDLSR